MILGDFMAKYYIVSRIGDEYDLIKVGDKTKLEEIDTYTLNFKNKEELINNINSNGNDISTDSDLFIVYMNKGEICTKEILYESDKNFNIKENIDLSLNGDLLVCYPIFKEVFALSKNIEFSNMMLSSIYSIYSDFKNLVYSSHKNIENVKFNKNNAWLRKSYNNLRDLCVLMNDYDKMMPKRSFIFLGKKTELEKERRSIFTDLKRNLTDSFGQLSFIGGPNNYIHITELHPDNIPDKHVLKGGKEGSIKPQLSIEMTTMPDMAMSYGSTEYKLDLDSIKKVNLCYQSKGVKDNATKQILRFLTSDYYMPGEAIKYKDDKYYIDFDVFDYKYSDEEKKELSSLMSQKMMGLVKGYKNCSDRMKDPFLSGNSMDILDQDRNAFRRDIKRYLDKYADKNSKSINKIFRFCQVQKEVIDNTKGRKR